MPKVRAGALSPSTLAMQHNRIKRYLLGMALLAMCDTLRGAEGGRARQTEECSGGMHHVHREQHSGAYPLAPPHTYMLPYTRPPEKRSTRSKRQESHDPARPTDDDQMTLDKTKIVVRDEVETPRAQIQSTIAG